MDSIKKYLTQIGEKENQEKHQLYQVKKMEKEYDSNNNVKNPNIDYKLLYFKSSNPSLLIENFIIIECNYAAVKILEYNNREELLGLNIYEISPFKELKYSLEAAREIVSETLKKGMGRFLLCYQRRNGKQLNLEITAELVRMNNRNIVSIFLRDAIEGKNINKHYSHPNQKSNSLNNFKLFDANLEYEKLRIQFFANLSHEFRTPLNVILGTVQTMESNYISLTDSENDLILRNKIKVLKQNGYRLLRLINNLIDITKIDAGNFKLKLTNENIVELIENIVFHVAEHVKRKELKIIFDTEIEERYLCCDSEAIERIILNLLSNSIKFTAKGGEIRINIYNRPEEVIITVEDTGIGIPEDEINNIFGLFRQVDKTFTRRHEGSGIGLALVKYLIEMHGGRISVSSKYGKGSKFIISLPVIYSELVQKDFKQNDNINDKIEIINMEFSDIYY